MSKGYFNFGSKNQEPQEELLKKGRESLGDGSFSRDASDRLCYEVLDLELQLYLIVRKKITREFNLIPFGITIRTSDAVFKTYIQGFKRIGIEWDIWSGFIVVAKNKRAEPLVREVGDFLENRIQL